MKTPVVNLLPCPESLSKGTRTFLSYILLILALAAGFSYAADSLDFDAYEMSRLPAIVRLPCYLPYGILSVCLTLCMTFIFVYVVKGMQTFYMPFKKSWISFLVLICLDAFLSLLPETDLVEILGFILELSSCIVCIALGYGIRKSYSGKISMLGTALMWSTIVSLVVGIIAMIYFSVLAEQLQGLSYWEAKDALKSAFWKISIPVVIINLIELWPVIVSFTLFENGEREEYIEPSDLPEAYGQPEA